MSAQIQKAVDRGLEIIAQIERLDHELKGIEALLEYAALHGEQQDLNDPEREGRQFLAHGSKATVPVILTADLLVKSFAAESATHKAIEAVAADKLTEFFKPVNTFKTFFDSGKIFRRKADEILGKNAPAFITACVQKNKAGIAKSQIKIEWDRAEGAA